RSEPGSYTAQSTRARAAVARDHRPARFADRIAGLVRAEVPAPAQRGRNGPGPRPVTPEEVHR
ncbi:MAG TPA: hypothetical protein VN408_40745, partial [Actinoplanes sp.]|nr:hypothetical protein [Actinoplanes sp.]